MFDIVQVTPISKFYIAYNSDIKPVEYLKIKNNQSHLKNINFNKYFWNLVFNKEFLNDFLINKYLKNKKDTLTKNNFLELEGEIKFLLEKTDILKINTNILSNTNIPKGEDIFFSFRFFNSILYYINDYYAEDNIHIGLKEGIVFHKNIQSIDNLIENIDYYKNTKFIKTLIKPFIEKFIKTSEKKIYQFEIFWPNELLMVGIIGNIIKKINPEAKIVVDLSSGNEQFDFTQWVSLIKKADSNFFKFYDFFVVDRDFGSGLVSIKKFLEGKIEKTQIKNIIFYEDKVLFNKIHNKELPKNIFEEFIKKSYNKNNIHTILGLNNIRSRFLPYKCYWSSCSFCAINSQNIFSYDPKYSYDFFIEEWISFIKKYKIKAMNFNDEALPPVVIIKFAKKLIENNLKVNYQFRTRFEKLYTLQNCKILAKSGCGYCGIGLESAVDRVNEEIGNKGNKGITIKDKIKIIHNFDKAGVSIHNYSIMGFPGETDKEAAVTYKFLKDNITNSNYYTCTPNIFGLMKGPKIFSEREKYGVEVAEEDLQNPFNLIYDFKYKGKERNLRLLKKFEEDLHKTQFLPWLNKSIDISGTRFWEYLDRSYVFYLLKRFHSKNPFYAYKDVNNIVLKKEYEDLLDEKFKISDYIQFFEYESDSNIYLYDWVGCLDFAINKKFKNLIINYKNNISLKENIKSLETPEIKKIIYFLLENRLLLHIKD